MFARSRLLAVGTLCLGFLSAGCVSVDKYEAVRLERDGLRQQLDRSQTEVTAANAKAASYKVQIDQLMAAGPNSSALAQNLQQQNTQLQLQLADYERRYNDLVNKVGQGPALPAVLTSELTKFANENADLVDFDAQKGIVKFKSDVTFASGDATLKPDARQVIDRFSKILNSNAARSYELFVAGHTDNKPVSNPATLKLHPNNWYLSSHRAISVGNELIKSGVTARRIGVVGYADQRPIASNDTPAGMAANRRVEVLILPTTVSDVMASPSNEAAKPTVTQSGDEMNK